MTDMEKASAVVEAMELERLIAERPDPMSCCGKNAGDNARYTWKANLQYSYRYMGCTRARGHSGMHFAWGDVPLCGWWDA